MHLVDAGGRRAERRRDGNVRDCHAHDCHGARHRPAQRRPGLLRGVCADWRTSGVKVVKLTRQSPAGVSHRSKLTA